jgi:hypothetical protein
MSRKQYCTHRSCSEVRARHSMHRMCEAHDAEADEAENNAYAADPQRDIERQLADCASLEDIKSFILEHVLKGDM